MATICVTQDYNIIIMVQDAYTVIEQAYHMTHQSGRTPRVTLAQYCRLKAEEVGHDSTRNQSLIEIWLQ